MRKILILLIILLSSCSDNDISYECKKGTIRILNKNKYTCARGSVYCSFYFYLYDGNNSYWCNTDKETYSLYEVNDTLPTLVITKTIKSKK